MPVLFAVGWLVGFALRERAEQTEAAEQRAARAERERENAARLAVAEERARIARELHDVVAHAVSVMVLQVGAVRHRMPQGAADREALHNVEHAGRTALAEMRRLLGAMRRDDDELELTPQPGLDMLPGLLEDVRAAGLDVRLVSRRSTADAAPRSGPVGLPHPAGRPDQRAQARARTGRATYGSTTTSPSSSSRSAMTAEARPRPTASAMDWSGSVSGSRSTAVS